MTKVEQILPTLLTRDEFKTAIKELREDISRDMDARIQRALADLRNEMLIRLESLEDMIRRVAEGHVALWARLDEILLRLPAPPKRARESKPGLRRARKAKTRR